MVVCGGFHGDLFSMWPREYIEGYGVFAQKDVGGTCSRDHLLWSAYGTFCGLATGFKVTAAFRYLFLMTTIVKGSRFCFKPRSE